MGAFTVDFDLIVESFLVTYEPEISRNVTKSYSSGLWQDKYFQIKPVKWVGLK